MHPCRKLKLNEMDQKILAALEGQELGLDDLQEIFPSIARQQLKKRLVQLKKHGHISADSNLERIRSV